MGITTIKRIQAQAKASMGKAIKIAPGHYIMYDGVQFVDVDKTERGWVGTTEGWKWTTNPFYTMAALVDFLRNQEHK